jgi:hypothetical protein
MSCSILGPDERGNERKGEGREDSAAREQVDGKLRRAGDDSGSNGGGSGQTRRGADGLNERDSKHSGNSPVILKALKRLFEKPEETLAPFEEKFGEQEERLKKAREHLMHAARETENASAILQDLIKKKL